MMHTTQTNLSRDITNGDRIDGDNLANAQRVAIGPNARAEINRYFVFFVADLGGNGR